MYLKEPSPSSNIKMFKMNSRLSDQPVAVHSDVIKYVVEDTVRGNSIKCGAIRMNNDIEDAKVIIENQMTQMDNVISRLRSKEQEVADTAKEVSAKVRISTEKLNQGMAKIEKLANFNRLEVLLTQLERAELALSSLAKLEQSGKLDKILNALK